MVKFSIIIPVYNSGKYLVRCLDSIYNQKYSDFEALIIDDDSKDASKKIIKEYEEKDSRFRYIHKSNGGPGLARNLGMKMSKGEYICFADSDDELLPNYFSKINKILTQNKLDILEINAFYQQNETGPLKKYQQLNFNKKIMNGVEYLYSYLNKYKYFNVVPWTKVINRKFMLKNNLFFENIYAEDELWARKCFVLASRVMFLDECLYLQHQRNNSLSKSNNKTSENNVVDQKQTFRKLEKFYIQHNNSKYFKRLFDELSHNFIAVSILNENVKISRNDKLFALRNAKSLSNFLNALLFYLSPTLRKYLKEW